MASKNQSDGGKTLRMVPEEAEDGNRQRHQEEQVQMSNI